MLHNYILRWTYMSIRCIASKEVVDMRGIFGKCPTSSQATLLRDDGGNGGGQGVCKNLETRSTSKRGRGRGRCRCRGGARERRAGIIGCAGWMERRRGHVTSRCGARADTIFGEQFRYTFAFWQTFRGDNL